MANAVVEILLDELQQLLIYRTHLIGNVKEEAQNLEKALRLCSSFLRQHDGCFRQINDVVYKAEKIVETIVAGAAEIDSRDNNHSIIKVRAYISVLKNKLRFRSQTDSDQQGTTQHSDQLFNVQDIATEVNAITEKVKNIYDEWDKLVLDRLDSADEHIEDLQLPPVRHERLVGFENVAKQIIEYLKENSTDHKLDVISIFGMPSTGKTVLARKILHDTEIQNLFPVRIWVDVSQEFDKQDVYHHILNSLGEITDRRNLESDDDQLARTVCSKLEKAKFLIVMDDVWTPEDWDEISKALPKSNGTSKVLLTSRYRNVAGSGNEYELGGLTQEESWLLLQLVVFGKYSCPPELEVLGRSIAEGCKGLPLAVLLIGGILANGFPKLNGMSAKMVAWAQVMNNVNKMETLVLENIISLSYESLPHHLHACFLYLGMFPQGFEIPAWKLIRMWIAEGFIQQKDGITLEETGEHYLDNLVSWNLVRVDKRRRDGRVKTCRVYDDIHIFCRNKAGTKTENFLEEIGSSVEEFDNEVRRICMHSTVLKSISPEHVPPSIRSIACFTKKGTTDDTSAVSFLTALKLVRVMDVKPVTFAEIPADMYQLVHLRYLALSLNATVLPEAFAKLWNIQTLIVDTESPTLEVKADIWKLSQLRHLKTNASTSLPKEEASSREGEKLQTLGTISPQSCRDEVFDRARNLKKLGIRGKLSLLVQGKTPSFGCLGRLSSLEKLKLLNDVVEEKLHSLPPPYQFPPKLKTLTLSNTYLSWDCMSTLAMLESLEVLKLKENAFVGTTWESKEGGFCGLKVLHIGKTDLVEWKALSNHLPKLKRLELHNCKKLEKIPIGLADVPDFGFLDLYQSNLAAAYARRICEEKKTKGEDCKFKLSIFPLSCE